jgi:hypothetical protein
VERIGRRRRFQKIIGRGWYTGGVKQFGHRAGRGGDVIPAPGRDKIGETRQSVLSALPFSLRFVDLHSAGKAAYLG